MLNKDMKMFLEKIYFGEGKGRDFLDLEDTIKNNFTFIVLTLNL
jgi:hypothetical protein